MSKEFRPNPFGGYVRITQPDKDRLSSLTELAIGNRSVRDFAKDCGVHPSTIYRLLKKEQSSANTDYVIAAIAENADPQSGVTMDMFIEAHGLALYDGAEHEKVPLHNTLRKREEMRFTRVPIVPNPKYQLLCEILGINSTSENRLLDLYEIEKLFPNSEFVIDHVVLHHGENPQYTAYIFCVGHSMQQVRVKMNCILATAYLFGLKKRGITVEFIITDVDLFYSVTEECRRHNIDGLNEDINIVCINITER